MTREPDVIIIGSGILGSSIASMMARLGYRVTVIERDLREPDRIVGELLQPGGCRALQRLGLEECLENLDGHTIKGYMIYDPVKKSLVEVPYHIQTDEHDISEGMAFHHGRFVVALRKAAMAEKNTHYIEGTVTELIEEDSIIMGVKYRNKGSTEVQELRAPLTVVADGCFSKFRKGLIKRKPSTKSYFVGLIMKNCPQAKANHAELVLAESSPILIYQISSNSTRILVDIQGDLPRDLKTYFTEVIYPQLPEHIQGPFLESVKSGRIRSMPNSFLPPSPILKAGVLCLGDAFNMRHPLTGAGMTVAFNDVVMCQDLFKDIPDLHDYDKVQDAVRRLYSTRKNNHSFVVNVLSMALYELFAASDDNLRSLKSACFEYFKLGGNCIKGPVDLLSVLNPKPHILLYHFFAVCLYAILHTFRSHPWWALHHSMIQSSGIFYKACGIIFPLVWSELKT